MSQPIEFSEAPLPVVHMHLAINRLNRNFPENLGKTIQGFGKAASGMLGFPFDMAREQYARTVRVGLIPCSMLAARDFSLVLDALERATLGPWARRV